jgi:hypothetical protein
MRLVRQGILSNFMRRRSPSHFHIPEANHFRLAERHIKQHFNEKIKFANAEKAFTALARRKHKLAAKHPQPPCLPRRSPLSTYYNTPSSGIHTKSTAPEISSHYYSGKSWPLRSNPFNMSEWKVSNANAIWSKKVSSQQPLKREERRAEKACACSLSARAIIIFAGEAAFSIIAPGSKSSITSATTTGGRMMDVMQMREREPANQIFVAKLRRERT